MNYTPPPSVPVFVDGIGPPLQQIEQDYREVDSGTSDDVLALIREVYRLLRQLDTAKGAAP